jgi:ABC-type transporter Mla MlaB component
MLRAMITDTPFEQRWVLQGRLCGEWAVDLAQQWAKRRNTRQGRRCVVDVEDVVSVDGEGEQLLLQMMSEGSEVVASRLYMKHLLESLKEPTRPRESGGKRC